MNQNNTEDIISKRWLNPTELEKEYGLKEDTMSKYRMKKMVPYSKIGTKIIRYDRLKIDQWLEEHEIECIHHAS